MPFEKGQSGNPSGRPTGSGNKATVEAREFIRELIAGNSDRVQSELDKLQGAEFLAAYLKLLPYAVPKMKPAEPPPLEDQDNLLIIEEVIMEPHKFGGQAGS